MFPGVSVVRLSTEAAISCFVGPELRYRTTETGCSDGRWRAPGVRARDAAHRGRLGFGALSPGSPPRPSPHGSWLSEPAASLSWMLRRCALMASVSSSSAQHASCVEVSDAMRVQLLGRRAAVIAPEVIRWRMPRPSRRPSGAGQPAGPASFPCLEHSSSISGTVCTYKNAKAVSFSCG